MNQYARKMNELSLEVQDMNDLKDSIKRIQDDLDSERESKKQLQEEIHQVMEKHRA